MLTALTADWLFTPLERLAHPVLLAEDGAIRRVGTREEIELPRSAQHLDFPGGTLAPGFLDLHIHGGAGHDLMATASDGLAAFERSLARQGVTSYLPTTVTAPLDRTLAALEKMARAIARPDGELRARPLSVHLEGPFLSHARRGVHPAGDLLEPSVAVFETLHAAAGGAVGLMTLAPELPGARALIEHATARGVRVSLGHSDAGLEQARQGIAWGATHATHTFNAMRGMSHRDPGLLAAVLTDDRLTADLIADGVHVHAEMVALFLRMKGPERAVLISDALSPTGMPAGRYRLGELEVEVRDGVCRSGETIAGSVLTLDRAVRNVMHFAGWDLQQAVRLATLNPARALGLEQRKGVLATGADADIVVLSSAGEVMETLVAGRPVLGEGAQ